jgi:hypothetical protein
MRPPWWPCILIAVAASITPALRAAAVDEVAVTVVLWEVAAPTNLLVTVTPSTGLAAPFTRIPFASNAFWHSVCHPGWILDEALALAINPCHVRAVSTKAIA